MGLIVVDRDSRISYANFAAEDYLDMLPGSLAGLRINELPVNIRATLLLCYYRALRDDVPDRFEENIRYDKRLGFNVYPDEQGMVITVEDVTREWRAGEVARISTLTIDSLPDAVMMLDRKHRIVHVNHHACSLSGYSKEELRGMAVREVLPGLDMLIQGMTLQGEDQNKPLVAESVLRRRDGGNVPVEVSVSRKKIFGITEYLVMARDITERKQAEENVKQARTKAELYLDLLGHDISNMHQIALGYLEMARDLMDAGECTREFLDRPIEVLQRSARLIKNVRKLQKLQEGALQTEPVDVCKVLEDVLQEFGTVPHKAITLNMNGCKDCHIHANELLHDVFANLVGNAIRHTGDRADIVIGLDTTGDDGHQYCRVTVEDNGPGIPDDFKDKIFSRGLKDSIKAKGMGIGLYLVKSLVESYDGRVWVEDRVPGDHAKGAKFVVMLPVSESP
jgi:PAS domain S-box-containing protein